MEGASKGLICTGLVTAHRWVTKAYDVTRRKLGRKEIVETVANEQILK